MFTLAASITFVLPFDFWISWLAPAPLSAETAFINQLSLIDTGQDKFRWQKVEVWSVAERRGCEPSSTE
jgi:hypothetical protein